MFPILLTLGRRPISSYSVVMGVTLLIVFGWLAWQQRRGSDRVFDLGLLMMATGLIGARIGHVAANWEYYGERWLAMLDLRDGGLSWPTGLAAGLLALAVAATLHSHHEADDGLRLRKTLALFLVPLSIGLLGGWLACLLAGCAYGRAVAPPQRFYTPDWPDSYGVLAYRLPSQLLGILLAGLLLLLARPLRRRPGLFLVLLGLGQFMIDWTRGDQTVSWGPLSATQWIDILLILIGIALEFFGHRARRQAT